MNDIQNIIKDFYVDQKKLCNYSDQSFKYDIGKIEEPSFKIHLSDYLYRNYYCGIIDKTELASDHNRKNGELLNKLKEAAGEYTISFDNDWIIEEKDHSGNVYAQKGYLKNILAAGQYLSNKYSKLTIESKSVIQKARVPYTFEKGDYFIFFYGKTSSESKGNFLVRFYFNTSAEHSPMVVNHIIKHLNKTQIPFEMKCPIASNSYKRDDTVVLYLNKKYSNYFLSVLNPLYAKIHLHLDSSVPLFTKKLYPGIGFAESPPDNNTSFGMSRCDLITQGLYSCISNEKPKSDWYQLTCELLSSQNFDIKNFHLNPINKYPYDFAQTTARNN